MPPVYLLTADSVPTVQAPTALFNPASGTPVVAEAWTTGDVQTLGKFNRNASRVDALALYGGGGFGVVWGLEVTTDADPLKVQISPGIALIGGIVPYTASSGKASLVDGGGGTLLNHLWLSRAGALQVVTGSLTAPGAGLWICLATIPTTGGALVNIDYSPRVSRGLGGWWERKSADTGVPTDTPPAAARFVHYAAGGPYFWEGSAYQRFVNAATLLAGVTDGFGVSSPSQITSDQNDYALASGIGSFRLSTDASRTITGFSGGTDGRRVNLFNVGAFDLVLADEDSGSGAENRVITGTASPTTLLAGENATLVYLSADLRWRQLL